VCPHCASVPHRQSNAPQIRRAVAHPVADTISFPFPPCASPLFRRFLNAQALRLSPIIR